MAGAGGEATRDTARGNQGVAGAPTDGSGFHTDSRGGHTDHGMPRAPAAGTMYGTNVHGAMAPLSGALSPTSLQYGHQGMLFNTGGVSAMIPPRADVRHALGRHLRSPGEAGPCGPASMTTSDEWCAMHASTNPRGLAL